MSGTKILIIDDEEIMRESLAGWLARDGYFVDTAASGEESLEKIKKTRFDILLVDIKMEGMSGLEPMGRFEPETGLIVVTLAQVLDALFQEAAPVVFFRRH